MLCTMLFGSIGAHFSRHSIPWCACGSSVHVVYNVVRINWRPLLKAFYSLVCMWFISSCCVQCCSDQLAPTSQGILFPGVHVVHQFMLCTMLFGSIGAHFSRHSIPWCA